MNERIRRDSHKNSPTRQAEEQERAAREANEARWAQVDIRIRRDERDTSPRFTNARWAMARVHVSAYAAAARVYRLALWVQAEKDAAAAREAQARAQELAAQQAGPVAAHIWACVDLGELPC